MKKFLIGLLCGFVLAGMGCVIVFFAMARLGARKPAVPDGATLVLRLSGPIPEQPRVEIPLRIFESQSPVTMVELWEVLHKAEKDTRVKSILLEPRGIGVGWARLQEIREGIVRFKRSGKPVYAFLNNPGAREYYLATAADKIYFTREDLLDVKGMRAELTFYRKTLDKIGVEFEMEHAGKYKDAADSYVRTSMTPETREVINSILDQVYGDFVKTVGLGRKRSPEQVRALIDEGPFLAPEAKAKGLVDDLLFEDQANDALRTALKQTELRKVSLRDYVKVPAASLGLEGRTRFALVVGEGTITRGGDGDLFGDEEGIRSGAFRKMLRQVADDATIRGVILRVNSPGGDAIASDEILREVQRLSARKPLVVSMSDMAASGGYYIAMSGDPVLAYPNTFTGSIGVIYGKLNLRGLYEKLGFTTDVITRGRNADIDSSIRPMDENARRKLKEGINYTYRTFISAVADGRKRKVEQIEPLAEGRVWMGAQAKSNGLVDELGGLDRAIEILRAKAKLAPEEKIRLVAYPKRKTIFEQIFGPVDEVSAASIVDRKFRALAAEFGLDGIDFNLWRRGAMMKLVPFSVRIQ